MSKVTTPNITNAAVDKDKINTDVAGAGLTGGNGTALAVNTDDVTLEVSTDTVRVKALGIDTAQLAAQAVEAAKLGSDVAGNGITGGAGSALAAQADAVGGANLALAISVTTNGIAVKVDDTTIEGNGSNQLQVKANSIDASHIDETDDYTWTASHDFTGGACHVATPSSDTHAVTKAYADSLRAGVRAKDPSRAMRDTDIAITGDPGTVDGVTSWSTGERILLTNQTDPIENGIWEVNTAGAWTRPSDFFTGDEASGAQTWIDQGTNYGESQWTCTTNEPNDIIGTNSLAFSQTAAAGQVTAGIGLTKSGNTINIGSATGDKDGISRTADDIGVKVDDSTIEISSHAVQIKASGVGATQLSSGVAGTGLSGGGGSALSVDYGTGSGTACEGNDARLGYWARTSTTVYPGNAGDDVKVDLGTDTSGYAIVVESDGSKATTGQNIGIKFALSDNADAGSITAEGLTGGDSFLALRGTSAAINRLHLGENFCGIEPTSGTPAVRFALAHASGFGAFFDFSPTIGGSPDASISYNPGTGDLTIENKTSGDLILKAAGADDVNFDARGSGSIPLNETGDVTLSGFTAVSLIGAANENRADIDATVGGSGISGGAGADIDLDIHGLSAETSLTGSDELAFWDIDPGANKRITVANFKTSLSLPYQVFTEMQIVTATHVTNGYLTLNDYADDAKSVKVSIKGGVEQLNKQITHSGVVPDFDLLSTNQLHINNNGAATGLSQDIVEGDVLIIQYSGTDNV